MVAMIRVDTHDVHVANANTAPLGNVAPVGQTEKDLHLPTGSAVHFRSSTAGGLVTGVILDKKGSLLKVAYQLRGQVLMKAVRDMDVVPAHLKFTEDTDSSADPSVAEATRCDCDRETLASRTDNTSENTDSESLMVGTVGMLNATTSSTVCQRTAAKAKTGMSMSLAALSELRPASGVGLPNTITESTVCQATAANVITDVTVAVAAGCAGPRITNMESTVCRYTSTNVKRVEGMTLAASLGFANTESTVSQDMAANVKTGMSMTLAALPEILTHGSERSTLSTSCLPEPAGREVRARLGQRLARGSEGRCELSVRKLHELLTGPEARKVQAIDLRSMRLDFVYSCLPGARHAPIEGFTDQAKSLASEFAYSSSIVVLYNAGSMAYQTKRCADLLWHEVQMNCESTQCQVRFFGGDVDQWEDYWRSELDQGSQVLIRDSGTDTWSRGSVIHATGDEVAVSSMSSVKIFNFDSDDLLLALPEE